MHAKYTRLTKLMGIKTNGRMEVVFEAALDSLLDRRDPERRAKRRQVRNARSSPPSRSDSRTVPQALRDEVWSRDSGRCTFLNTEGSRCPATSWLEIDHIKPYALGGRSDDIDNLRLLCRAHNQLMARRIFNYPRG
jgi:5-methylcytosine-specific restriction endonuclease McrA